MHNHLIIPGKTLQGTQQKCRRLLMLEAERVTTAYYQKIITPPQSFAVAI